MTHSNGQNGVQNNITGYLDKGGDSHKNNTVKKNKSYPKLGPEPTLLSRNEVDALYETVRHMNVFHCFKSSL